MKLPDPNIRIINHTLRVGSRSGHEGNAVTAAHLGYIAGAEAVASMLRDAVESRDIQKVWDLYNHTKSTTFYEYDRTPTAN
jgi:hypothetical protein